MKTLLLKLAGPLQSWGTSSRFETRQTDIYPSKSAIIGLLAGSLGYRRDENEKIQRLNDLNFAVRIDQHGTILRDFHVAQKLKPNGDIDRNYVTNRYCLQDAIFVISIGSSDEELIEEIASSLRYPYFQPFLGRRSFVMNADFFIGVKDGDVISNIKDIPWQASNWYKRKPINSLVIYADSDLLNSEEIHMRQDRVLSFSQKNRKFGFRYESRMSINITCKSIIEEHDSFE